MKSQAVWLSYDLGIPGDYDVLYSWFDQHDAKVCGRNVAFLNYSYRENFKEELTEELRPMAEPTRKACMYAIYYDIHEQKIKGTYLVGRRRWTPWHGYAEIAAKDDC